MSRREKLLARLASSPRDFTWDEFESLMRSIGFEILQRAGSRVTVQHPEFKERFMQLHVPHGRSPKTMLVGYVNDAAKRLREWGYYD